MKRQSATCTNHCTEIADAQHHINKLLDALSAGQNLKLPNQLSMSAITDKGSKRERLLNSGQINQVWRYGGKVISEIDENRNSVSRIDDDLEKQLFKIIHWIEGELRKP